MSRLAMTVPEAAEAAGVTEKILRAAIHAGDLRAKRQSRNKQGEGVGKYLVKTADLEAWFDGLPDA